MRSFVSFRLAAVMCLASGVLCMFSPFKESWPAFALLIGLTLIAGFGAAGSAKPAIRLVWGLLPAVSLVLAGSGWTVMAALLVLTGYIALFLTLGRFSIEHWRYRGSVYFIFAVAFLFVVISGLGSVNSMPSTLMSAAAPVLALLALRSLRMGAAPSLKWQAGNVGLFLLPVACGVLVGAVLWLTAPPIVKVLSYAFSAMLGAIVFIVNFVFSGILWAVGGGEDLYEETTTLDEVASTDVTAEAATEPSHNTVFSPMQKIEVPWEGILILLAVIVVIVLAIWLIRRGRASKKTEEQEKELAVDDVLLHEPRARRNRRKKSDENSYRAEIRFIYREYLAFLKKRDVRPNLSTTTEEISSAAESVLHESDERLREIYRRCRYSTEPVTKEDVALAKAALEDILHPKDDQKEETP
ncbi:MAG: hypothetical protein IK104_09695 [Clostridia bacterium]|nr:hypothetical protein [Clostridia bacterium]